MQHIINEQEISDLTDCAADHIKEIKALTQKQRKKTYELPCGCEEVALENLMSEYACSECEEFYFYSFCWDEVVQDNDTWHCKDCKECRDWLEWHCKSCNICNSSTSLPCKGCGKKSPYAVE